MNAVKESVKHRWSGWPGAYCLYCGSEDMTELSLACPDCRQTWPPQQGPWYVCEKHQASDCGINKMIQVAEKRGWTFRPDHYPVVWESPFGSYLAQLPREVYSEDL